MPPAQRSRTTEDDRVSPISIEDRDAGGTRARPSHVSVHAGPVAASTAKPLTAKEQAAAEEAKEKLERMVKVCIQYKSFPLQIGPVTDVLVD